MFVGAKTEADHRWRERVLWYLLWYLLCYLLRYLLWHFLCMQMSKFRNGNERKPREIRGATCVDVHFFCWNEVIALPDWWIRSQWWWTICLFQWIWPGLTVCVCVCVCGLKIIFLLRVLVFENICCKLSVFKKYFCTIPVLEKNCYKFWFWKIFLQNLCFGKELLQILGFQNICY